jgi:hypothetical protein
MNRRLSHNESFEYGIEENNSEYICHIKITIFWDVMGRLVPIFWRNLLLPSSALQCWYVSIKPYGITSTYS